MRCNSSDPMCDASCPRASYRDRRSHYLVTFGCDLGGDPVVPGLCDPFSCLPPEGDRQCDMVHRLLTSAAAPIAIRYPNRRSRDEGRRPRRQTAYAGLQDCVVASKNQETRT